jgi:CRP-like cAMP-binding protein
MRNMQGESGQIHDLWEQLRVHGADKFFARNTLIYTPDEFAESLYLLQSGQVNLYMISTGGRILTLQVLEQNHLFGHSVLAGNPTYDTFAETITPVRATVISREGVLRALHDNPALGLVLVEIVEQYLLAASRRLDELAFKSVPARLASVLLDMADATASGQTPRLPRRTHQQLADMTNAYRATVTKVIKQFRSDRLLDIDRSGITLLNTSRLRELARE